MKRHLSNHFVLWMFLLALILNSYASTPTSSNNKTISSSSLTSKTVSKTRVLASQEEWHNTGIQVAQDITYRISAKGQWRVSFACNYTGPDGIGLYNFVCPKSPLFPTVLEGYSHSILIARIGKQGKIFAIGADYEFKAQVNGTLFLRINDTLKWTSDNDGFMDVEIHVLSSQQGSDLASNTRLDSTDIAASANGSSLKSSETNLIALDNVDSRDRLRTALVIGNGDYIMGSLKNPVNDAKAMAASLERLGFTVILRLNANQEQIESALDDFSRKLLGGNQVALFYYAGHGVQVDGENYLIPTEAIIKRQSDVRYKAVNIGQILGAMGEAKDNLNIVIMDACRDNPLPRSFRNTSRGLARIEGPKGTIIGFATSPGSVAADGEGDNGVYTKHLLANMDKPGLSVEQVFKQVLRGVHDETNGQQVPWTESSFTGDFSFNPRN